MTGWLLPQDLGTDHDDCVLCEGPPPQFYAGHTGAGLDDEWHDGPAAGVASLPPGLTEPLPRTQGETAVSIILPTPICGESDALPVVVLASCDCDCDRCFDGRHCYFPPCTAGVQDTADARDIGPVLPRPLQFPPAIPASPVRITCPCGKDGSDYAHGGIGDRLPFTCDEVRAIRRRVEAGAAQPRRALRRLFRRIRGGAR